MRNQNYKDMKKLLFVGALLCVLCSCGSGNSKKSNVHEGHEWVDLGLPSGLKWATCNVGASTPGDYGNYYAWGETRPKSEYTEYNSASDGKSWGYIGGNSSRDAARANWGGNWRMPTEAEFQELIDNCTWTWTTQNGHKGYKVTGPNGNSIFLPAAGYRERDALYDDGEDGYYGSSTSGDGGTGGAYSLCFYKGGWYVGWGDRVSGISVRPVLAAGKIDELLNSSTTGTYKGHEWVDLGLSVKWATCNVGASTPGDYGNYYAWGETSTKSNYDYDNSTSLGKSWSDIGGNSSRDAARANWGGSWRMPTKTEFQELIDNCTWTWTTQNGYKGYRVTGENGQSIFLPAAGLRNGDTLYNDGVFGFYWSSTPNESYSDYAYDLCFYESRRDVSWDYRYLGVSVRPVLEN